MTGPREGDSPRPGQPPARPAVPPPDSEVSSQDLPRGGPDSDAELLRRHVKGDSDAFGLLFLRHRDRLWAVALRTLADPEEAADALQDAMISAFRRADSFRGDSAVTTWLHRIVVNACLDRLRRRAARPVSAGLDEQALDLLSRDPPVPDHGAATDTALEVTAALHTLAAEQRAALVLVDMLGYPVADAAEVLGVSVGTVKSRCARGRARLLPRLAHLREAPPDGAGPAPPPPGAKPPDPRPPDPRHPAAAAGDLGAGGLAAPQQTPGKRNPALPGYVSPAEGGGDSRS